MRIAPPAVNHPSVAASHKFISQKVQTRQNVKNEVELIAVSVLITLTEIRHVQKKLMFAVDFRVKQCLNFYVNRLQINSDTAQRVTTDVLLQRQWKYVLETFPDFLFVVFFLALAEKNTTQLSLRTVFEKGSCVRKRI